MASQSRSAASGIFLFGLIWCSLIGVFDYVFFSGLSKQLGASRFVPTEATVVESRVVEHEGDDSTSYEPYLLYRYRVGGQDFQSDQHRRGMAFNGGRSDAQDMVDSHPVGSKLQIWYSPETPAQAVIEKNLSGMDLFFPMFLTPFNVVGLVLIMAPYLNSRRSGPGGVPVVREGLGWRARLKYTSPLGSVLGWLGALTFGGVFVVGLGSMMHPSLLLMQAAWTFVIGASLRGGFKSWQSNRAGAEDLRVQPGRVEFSCQGQPVSFSSADVREISIRREEKRDSDGDKTYSYEIDLHLQSGATYPLHSWTDEADANEFAEWLRGHVAGQL